MLPVVKKYFINGILTINNNAQPNKEVKNVINFTDPFFCKTDGRSVLNASYLLRMEHNICMCSKKKVVHERLISEIEIKGMRRSGLGF